MKNKRTLFFIVASMLIPSVHFMGQGELTEANFRIIQSSSGRECTLDDIVNDLLNYDVLFFGEEHNDSVGHYLEAKLLGMLQEAFPGNCALSMEMFDRDVQLVMDEYLSGAISERSFKKDARVWSNYSDYRPMVELAKEKGMHVVCANAAGRYSSMAVSKGMSALKALPAASKMNFAPLPYDTASGPYHTKLMSVFNEMHGSSNSEPAPDNGISAVEFNLIMGQSLWDATMAWSIASYLKKHKGQKVMQVNGRFHSDEKFAAVTQLLRYNKKLRPLVISCGPEENFRDADVNAFRHLGDYIILTDPEVPRTYEE